jgi:hypothetical protein
MTQRAAQNIHTATQQRHNVLHRTYEYIQLHNKDPTCCIEHTQLHNCKSVTIHFTPGHHCTSLQFTSLHFTTLHSPFFTSLHFWTFHHYSTQTPHFFSLIITFLTLFQKICGLQRRAASASAGSWLHSLSCLQSSTYRCKFFVSWPSCRPKQLL